MNQCQKSAIDKINASKYSSKDRNEAINIADFIDREKLLELVNESCFYSVPLNDYQKGCNDTLSWIVLTIKNMPSVHAIEGLKSLKDSKNE